MFGVIPNQGPLYSRMDVGILFSRSNNVSNGLCSIQEILDVYSQRVKANMKALNF